MLSCSVGPALPFWWEPQQSLGLSSALAPLWLLTTWCLPHAPTWRVVTPLWDLSAYSTSSFSGSVSPLPAAPPTLPHHTQHCILRIRWMIGWKCKLLCSPGPGHPPHSQPLPLSVITASGKEGPRESQEKKNGCSAFEFQKPAPLGAYKYSCV